MVRKQYEALKLLMFAGAVATVGSLSMMVASAPSAVAVAIALSGLLACVPFLLVQMKLAVQERWAEHPEAQNLIARHRALSSELDSLRSGTLVEQLQKNIHTARDEIAAYKRIHDNRSALLAEIDRLNLIVSQQKAEIDKRDSYIDGTRQGQIHRIINEPSRPTRDRNGNPIF